MIFIQKKFGCNELSEEKKIKFMSWIILAGSETRENVILAMSLRIFSTVIVCGHKWRWTLMYQESSVALSNHPCK